MNKYNELKEIIKEEARLIRMAKQDFKESQRNGDDSGMFDLQCRRSDLRHMHVAYSLALGNEYDSIEPKVREGNEISWYSIEKIQEKYGLPIKEAV